MRLFHCDRCGQIVPFSAHRCPACDASLGYVTEHRVASRRTARPRPADRRRSRLHTRGNRFERRWPTHRPATFPHHDVWHAFTIAAVGLHFAAIYRRDVTIDPAAPFTDSEAP